MYGNGIVSILNNVLMRSTGITMKYRKIRMKFQKFECIAMYFNNFNKFHNTLMIL